MRDLQKVVLRPVLSQALPRYSLCCIAMIALVWNKVPHYCTWRRIFESSSKVGVKKQQGWQDCRSCIRPSSFFCRMAENILGDDYLVGACSRATPQSCQSTWFGHMMRRPPLKSTASWYHLGEEEKDIYPVPDKLQNINVCNNCKGLLFRDMHWITMHVCVLHGYRSLLSIILWIIDACLVIYDELWWTVTCPSHLTPIPSPHPTPGAPVRDKAVQNGWKTKTNIKKKVGHLCKWRTKYLSLGSYLTMVCTSLSVRNVKVRKS